MVQGDLDMLEGKGLSFHSGQRQMGQEPVHTPLSYSPTTETVKPPPYLSSRTQQ